MNLDQLAKDWQWVSFLAQYCAGGNIDKAICRDFMGWGAGAVALLAVLLLWWILARIARTYRNWAHRRSLARVADSETMKQHVWSGYTPDARTSSEQRAQKTRNPA